MSTLPIVKRLTYEFMMRPSLHLGVGWEQQLLPSIVKLERLSSQAHKFVSHFIVERYKLSSVPPGTKYDELVWAFALLSSPRLNRFLSYLGAVFVGQEVQQAIARSTVSAYRDVLGDELYTFIIQRAPLITKADYRVEYAGPERIVDVLLGAGSCVLRDLCDSYSTALWPRVRLKLPYQENMDQIQVDVMRSFMMHIDIANMRKIALRVLREIEPTWSKQFLTVAVGPG